MEKKNKFNLLLVVPRYPMDKRSVNSVNYRYQFPFGLGYISSVIKKEGYNLDILNLNHYNGSIEEIINKKLNEKKYDFVMTGNNALGYAVTEHIIQAVRKHPSKTRFILGGPIITSEPEIVFRALNPDFAVVGEGEETIVELLESLEKNKNLKKVKGIVFLDDDGKIVMTPRREVVANLDSLPLPDFEGLEYEKQLENVCSNDFYFTQMFDYPRVYPILGSRGCPFNCTFCYHEGAYRKRDVKNILEEIKQAIKKYKINMVNLYDECFYTDKKRMEDFCEGMKKIREETPWDLRWACQLSVAYVSEELLRKMKDAGCVIISYGFESFSSEVLRSMRKPITPEQIEKGFKETLRQKIGVQGFFIFGDVAETKKSVKTTLDWWKKNGMGQIGLGFIQPYPGSEIYRHCLRKGIIKDKLDYIKNQVALDHWFNMTEKMSDEEIKKLKKEVLDSMGKYCKFVRPISKKKMKEHNYEFKIRCPFCGKINIYKNCYIPSEISYGFYMVCRDCNMRFFIVSLLHKIGYQYYPTARTLRDLQVRILEYFKRKRL